MCVYSGSKWGESTSQLVGQEIDKLLQVLHPADLLGQGLHLQQCVDRIAGSGRAVRERRGPTATTIKSVKHAMAGEYSRELSATEVMPWRTTPTAGSPAREKYLQFSHGG